VLLVNLDPTTHRTVTLNGLLSPSSLVDTSSGGNGSAMTEWHLTGPNGMNATQMALNGKLLVAKVVAGGTEYDLPPLEGQQRQEEAGGPPVVELAPASIAFVQLQTPSGVCSP
jgi:hypothetical protein